MTSILVGIGFLAVFLIAVACTMAIFGDKDGNLEMNTESSSFRSFLNYGAFVFFMVVFGLIFLMFLTSC